MFNLFEQMQHLTLGLDKNRKNNLSHSRTDEVSKRNFFQFAAEESFLCLVPLIFCTSLRQFVDIESQIADFFNWILQCSLKTTLSKSLLSKTHVARAIDLSKMTGTIASSILHPALD